MTLLPISKCLDCSREMDAARALDGDPVPTPNDVTVCFYCGHIMGFAEDMTLRPLTDEEMIEVAGNKDILRIQRARGLANERKN